MTQVEVHAENNAPVVLVIEDEPGDAQLIRLQLMEQDVLAYQIVLAGSLKDAEIQVKQQNLMPNAILLDLNLPDSSGVATVRRCYQLFPDVPVVVLTGLDDQAATEAAIEAGAEDYLSKGAEGRWIRKAIRYAILRHERDASERLAMAVFRHAREAIMITNAEQQILQVNTAFSDITGYSAEDVIGQTPALLNSGHHDATFFEQMFATLAAKGSWDGEIWNRRKDGSLVVETMNISAVHDARGQVVQYVALFSDITQKKAAQDKVSYLAYHDALTNLPNRTLFMDRFQQALVSVRRTQSSLALAFMDLDGFKAVNDTHGHAAGDFLLEALSEKMKACLREDDTLARLGGDEFLLLLQGQLDQQTTEQVLQRLLTTAHEPIEWKGRTLEVSVSIGACFIDGQSLKSPEDYITEADVAMYRAKKQGKNRYCFTNNT
ncbi:diguanylate cyclase [Nitrincola iocasae]|uniref:Diguanylate cyclase n=1 Tax=Nitrincola iocasae TaxID=2614693 RepID=A0A5J6LB68_9GAMM|nr:diguanylate cyclase [Nitrincola iocasae]QEW05839.1 diguanylate cyclase [Nitrincola iocasae]